MKKAFIAVGLSALLALPYFQPAQAQGPAKGGREMRGRGERRMRAISKMKLTRLWRGIGHLEKGRQALSKQQAKRVVALVRPWSTKPQMTDSQAESLHSQISGVLTAQQKSELEKGAAQHRNRGANDRNGAMRRGRHDGKQGAGKLGAGKQGATKQGARQGERRQGGWGQGGPGGGGFDRQRMEKMRSFFSTVNPFYAPTGYKEFKSMPERMQKGLTRRYEASRAILVALSKKAG